jgi:hypothetical protein
MPKAFEGSKSPYPIILLFLTKIAIFSRCNTNTLKLGNQNIMSRKKNLMKVYAYRQDKLLLIQRMFDSSTALQFIRRIAFLKPDA